MPTDKQRTSELQARHRERNFLRLLEYLRDHPCVDCSEADPIVLDFDHLPGHEKRFDISRAVSGSTRSWTAILAEIGKCEVVCANCHRRRTAARASFRKHLTAQGRFAEVAPLAPRVGRRVGHGEGSKGKRGCPCEACVTRRRDYQRELRARAREGAPSEGFEPPAMRVETACSSAELRGEVTGD